MVAEPETAPAPVQPPQPPAVTRLWSSLQTLGRLRDTYCRDKTPAGRLEAARAMAEKADQIKGLVAEVLAEAEGATGEAARAAR